MLGAKSLAVVTRKIFGNMRSVDFTRCLISPIFISKFPLAAEHAVNFHTWVDSRHCTSRELYSESLDQLGNPRNNPKPSYGMKTVLT